MSADRELLEMAAKAAGMRLNRRDGWVWCENVSSSRHWGLWMAAGFPTQEDPNPRPIPMRWNPLTDDGDALRLMSELRLVVHVWDDKGHVSAAKTTPDGDDPSADSDEWEGSPVHDGDVLEATRRAIVRAAASIGRSMP